MQLRHMCALAALAVTGCTHLPWKPHAGWRAWRTSNVAVYTDTVFQHGPALDWLDAVYDVYQGTFFQGFSIPPAEVLYLSTDITSPFLASSGATKSDVTIARWPWAEARGGRTLVIVGYSQWQWHYHHQLAHHFIEAAMPRAPLWFHEGFARYLTMVSGSRDRPGAVCYGREQPIWTTKVTLPLRELLAANFHDYNESSEPWIGPLAQSFVDYLLHGEGGRLRPRFRDLMRQLAAGKTGEEALTAVYQELPIDQMDPRFRNHVGGMRPPGEVCPLPFAVAAPLRPRIEAIKTPMAEADIRSLFEALEKLPGRNGYADFLPDQDLERKGIAP